MIVAQRKQASLIFFGGMLHTRSKSRKQRYKVDIHLPSCQKRHSLNSLSAMKVDCSAVRRDRSARPPARQLIHISRFRLDPTRCPSILLSRFLSNSPDLFDWWTNSLIPPIDTTSLFFCNAQGSSSRKAFKERLCCSDEDHLLIWNIVWNGKFWKKRFPSIRYSTVLKRGSSFATARIILSGANAK